MNDYLQTAGEGFQLLRTLLWLTRLAIFAPLIAAATWRRNVPHIPYPACPHFLLRRKP